MTNQDSRPRRAWFGGKREAIQDQYFHEALDANRWSIGDPEDWHTCWYTGMPKAAVFEQLNASKTINHIPGNNSLTVKSNLHATLETTRQRLIAQEGADSERARRMRFFPATYSMPGDYHALLHAAEESGKRWILKPKNSARGKDIRPVDDPATVPSGSRWMVQDYLDNPHTMFGRKYVLRVYVLITSVEPLRVYLYHEGSAKLASADYDPESLDNLYAHLTNPDVNATNEANTSPVVFVNLDAYREWLREQGHDDAILFTRLRELVTLTAISARETMRQRLQAVTANTAGCYELLGLDCLVDEELNPWLLECNLSPSLETCAALEDGGETEGRNKREMIEDLVRLLGLNEDPPDRSGFTPAERLIAEAEAERERAGGFQRVFPAEDADDYLAFLPFPRLADVVLADHACGLTLPRPIAQPRATEEIIADERLSLYNERTQTLYTPNPSAAWIWLQAADGAAPDRIASELAAARGGTNSNPDWATREEVWAILADWAVDGLLMQQTEAASRHASHREPGGVTKPVPSQRRIPLANTTVSVATPDRMADGRLMDALQPPTKIHDTASDAELQLVAMKGGYALTREQTLVATGLTLGAVVPEIIWQSKQVLAHATNRLVLPGALVPAGDSQQAIWILPDTTEHLLDTAANLAERHNTGIGGSVQIHAEGWATSPNLPLAVADTPRTGVSGYRHGSPNSGSQHRLMAASGDRRCYPITDVILPTHQATDAERLSVHELLPELLRHPTAGPDQPLGAERVSQVADWLGERALWVVNPSDTAGLDKLLKHAAPATGPAS